MIMCNYVIVESIFLKKLCISAYWTWTHTHTHTHFRFNVASALSLATSAFTPSTACDAKMHILILFASLFVWPPLLLPNRSILGSSSRLPLSVRPLSHSHRCRCRCRQKHNRNLFRLRYIEGPKMLRHDPTLWRQKLKHCSNIRHVESYADVCKDSMVTTRDAQGVKNTEACALIIP